MSCQAANRASPAAQQQPCPGHCLQVCCSLLASRPTNQLHPFLFQYAAPCTLLLHTHHVVDAAQDLLHFAYLRLVLKVDGRIEVRDLRERGQSGNSENRLGYCLCCYTIGSLSMFTTFNRDRYFSAVTIKPAAELGLHHTTANYHAI
jgi:hypothetical protein